MTAARPAVLAPALCLALAGALAAGARPTAPGAPAEPGNRKLAAMGYVDVTAAPFRADATGRTDATRPLQRAIDFAREHQRVAFFPPGTYTVSDTLVCVHGRHDPRTRKRRPDGRAWPCVLVGSRRGPRRPRIVLAPRSAGFGDPDKPKYVIHFWARSFDGDYDEPQPNINMNQMLVGIDVGIGEGNAGAVGVRHRAAQGSGVQDCTIDATHGLCGLEGGAGSGGSHANVTVQGGRIGADLRQTQPAPTITGFTLRGQTRTALLYSGRQALSAVGLRIESGAAGPAIVTTQPLAPHHGQVCLVDSAIEFTRPGEHVAIDAGASLTMHDVYVRGARTIVRAAGRDDLTTDRAGWLRVREYAVGIRPPRAPHWMTKDKLQYTSSIFLDGRRRPTTSLAAVEPVDAPPADLQARHLWGRQFPTWESPGAVNVKDAPFGAAGDGVADDAKAIQNAIDRHEIVFLPKGTYAVSRTIRLRPQTKLVGCHRCFSTLTPLGKAGGDFADPNRPQPLVRTANDARAETVLAFLKLYITYETPGAYCLEWRCGRKSLLRAVNTVLSHWWWPKRAPKRPYNQPLVVVRGHGGGKWYNFHEGCWRWLGPAYRHLLIEGTREPLGIYQCNPEYSRGRAEMEIRGARFVSIYGLKGEYNVPILWVRDSDHVRLFGYGGNGAGLPGRSLFVVERTGNFLLANVVDTPRLAGKGAADEAPGLGVDPRKWHMVIERPTGGKEIRTPPLERPVLYRRGRPRRQ